MLTLNEPDGKRYDPNDPEQRECLRKAKCYIDRTVDPPVIRYIADDDLIIIGWIWLTANGELKANSVRVVKGDGYFIYNNKKFPPGVYYLIRKNGREMLLGEKTLNILFKDDVYVIVPIEIIQEHPEIKRFKEELFKDVNDKKLHELLEDSIRNYGIIRPLIVDREYRLIDGYFRYSVAKKLGIKKVIVLRRSYDADEDFDKALEDIAKYDVIQSYEFHKFLKKFCKKIKHPICNKK
jgi:hypothetical protein